MLLKNNQGIIHKPFSKHTVTSFLENKQTRPMKNVTSNRIIVSRSHAGKVKNLIEKKMAIKADIIPAGGAGYKTMSLLEKNADLYLHSTIIKKWDICAPNAILNNLGGRLSSRNGKQIDYSTDKEVVVNGIIAALDNYDLYLDTFKENN